MGGVNQAAQDVVQATPAPPVRLPAPAPAAQARRARAGSRLDTGADRLRSGGGAYADRAGERIAGLRRLGGYDFRARGERQALQA